MDKKIGGSIIFGLFLVFGLIGLTQYVIGAEVSSDLTTDVLGNASISLVGDGFSNESFTKGNLQETVNVTVYYGLTSGTDNITSVNISWVGNFTFNYFVDIVDSQIIFGDSELNATLNNTVMNDAVGDWSCINQSLILIGCTNNSAASALGPNNATIIIRFNVTADSSTEDIADWNITVYAGDAGLATSPNSTILNTNVDGLSPRITDINITDGNITLINGTGFEASSTLVINDTWRLTSNADLIVFASVQDLNADSSATLQLVYNGTDNNQESNYTSIPGSNIGSQAVVNESGTIVNGVIVDSWKTAKANDANTLSALVKWTIPQSILINGNITNFQFLLNDSYDQGRAQGDGAEGGEERKSFKVETNSTMPVIENFNITDGVNTVSNGALVNGSFLAAGNWTVTADISGKGLTNVSIFFNETEDFGNNPTDLSLGAPFVNGKVPNSNEEFTEVTSDYTVRNQDAHTTDSATIEGWEVSAEIHANNDTQIMAFVVVANATLDAIDAGLSNFSIVGGPYYVTVDSTAPVPSINTPNVRSISTSDSIEYTCSANEGGSGTAKYGWYLKKPGASGYTLIAEETKSSGTDAQKFSGSDITIGGTYTVRCEVTDDVGNANSVDTTSSNDFTVSVSSISSGGGSGGGAGGGEATVSFDADFSQTTQASFKASQGRVKSFSFDGATKHTVTFNEVRDNGVTLVIASTPITVVLGIGEAKNVDINADGTDDMSVMLNAVLNGVADISLTKIQAGAEKIKAQEEATRGVTPEETIPSSTEGSSNLAWLWIAIIVVVALAIGYGIKKRK